MQYTATADWRLASGNRRGVEVGLDLDDLRRWMGAEVVDAMAPTAQFRQLQLRAELLCLASVHKAGGLSDEVFAERVAAAKLTYGAT